MDYLSTAKQQEHSTFTGWEYVLMDIAAQWGLDKLTFPKRLNWAYEHINGTQFEDMAAARGHWKEKPLFLKGVMALRKIQRGEPTGHMIGLDAANSGMQALSAVTGCIKGARATGMVDKDRRADAYTECTDLMQPKVVSAVDVERDEIKQACMTMLYGSKRVPKDLFGDDSPELAAFLQAMMEMAPGACRALKLLTNAWQMDALYHMWVLPDHHTANVPVMQEVETQIEVDELNHAKFKFNYEVNEGSERGISLIANVTHSIDGYLLRSLIRRCNYDLAKITEGAERIRILLLEKAVGLPPIDENAERDINLLDHIRYLNSGVVDVIDLDLILANPQAAYYQLDEEYLQKLLDILNMMLEVPPFPVVCIHDEFKCSPNNMNQLRKHYKNIMADLADGTVLHDVFTQITGKRCLFRKLSTDLGDTIRQSNYALC